MKKKVMFFMFSLHDGGAQRTVVNIINNLDKKKFEIILVLGSPVNNIYLDQIHEDIIIHNLNCKKLRFCLFKLTKTIRKVKPDLLFTTLNDNNIILSIANLFSFKNIPLIVREANTRSQEKNIGLINRVATKVAYNHLSRWVVALSEGVKSDLIENFNIKKEKIEVIYNPIEVDSIKTKSEEVVNDLGTQNSENTIIAIGRLTEQKDFSTLLKAFKLVNEKKRSRLLLLGKGELESELKQLAFDLDISEKVIFMGYKSNPYKYLNHSDIFVLSSKWEGFGHVIVEALATGTPVVSTNCPSGPSEILGDNEYGILSPVGDYEALAESIITLQNNNSLYDFYKNEGLKRAKDFKATKVVEKYSELFHKVIHSRL